MIVAHPLSIRNCACGILLAASCSLADISVSSYVQNGLIAHWDGIENNGTAGGHVADTAEWKDLVADRAFALTGVTVAEDRLVFAGTATSYGTLSAADTTDTFVAAKGGTLEIVYASATGASGQILLQAPAASGMMFSLWQNGGTDYVIPFAGSAAQPCFPFSSGTATNSAAVRYSAGVPASFAANGTAIASTYKQYYGTQGSVAIIGTRASKANNHFPGSIYAIRLYSRQLTAAEAAHNYAIDHYRFQGRWPDGYRYDAATDRIEVRLDVDFDPAAASIEADGVPLVAGTGLWMPLGASTTLSATPLAEGKAFYQWTNDVPAASRFDNPLTVSLDTPKSIFAVFPQPQYVAPGGTGDGSSWATARGSLADAIAALPNGGVVLLKSGTYPLTATITNLVASRIAFRGGYSGVGHALSGQKSVLARDTENTTQLRLFYASGADMAFERIKFTGGFIPGGCSGMAFCAASSSVALRDCEISGNGGTCPQATYNGVFYVSGGAFSAVDCVFRDNRIATDYYSSAVYGVGCTLSGPTSVLIDGCVFSNNSARVKYLPNQGMALYVSTTASSKSVTIRNSSFSGNYCQRQENYSHGDAFGGAVNIQNGNTTLQVDISDTTFEGNFLNDTGAVGGTMRLTGNSGNFKTYARLTRCVFKDSGLRPRDGSGGASRATDCGDLYSACASLTMTNCAFIGTGARNQFNVGDGVVDIYRCSFANATNGFAINVTAGTVTMRDSVLWGNAKGDISTSGSGLLTASYCVLQTEREGLGNFVQDPLLDPNGHLLSAAGYYADGFFAGGRWLAASATSRAIDAAAAETDVGDEPQPNFHRANIGAFAGTAVASKSVLGSDPIVRDDELKVFAHSVEAGEGCGTIRGEVASTGGGAAPTVYAVWDSADRGATSRAAWAHCAEIGAYGPWEVFEGLMTPVAGETYCRLVAENAGGAAFSDPPIRFAPAVRATLSAPVPTRVTRNTARLTATLEDDGNSAATVRARVWPAGDETAAQTFDYAAGFAVPEGETCVIEITGLSPATEYAYSFEALNGAGLAARTGTITTLSTAPIVRYVAPAGAGDEDGRDWANAYGKLQEALEACWCAGDVLYLKEGLYTASQPDAAEHSYLLATGQQGLTLVGGFAGEGAPGAKGGETILSRDTESTDTADRKRVLRAANATLAFRDLTIANGLITIGGSYGQGLYAQNSALDFSNCVFRANGGTLSVSYLYGGGLAVVGGSARLFDCVFDGNRVQVGNYSGMRGGAIYASGAAIAMTNCCFYTNRATTAYYDSRGGALYQSGGALSVSRCTFAGNYVKHQDDYSANSADRVSYGGAISLSGVPAAEILDCVFDGNYAQHSVISGTIINGAGGTICCEGATTVARIERCEFRNYGLRGGTSRTYDGGSVTVRAGSLSLRNSLFVNGRRNAVECFGGTGEVLNCTILGALSNALYQAGGTLTVRNSILWGCGGALDALGGTLSVDHTLSQDAIAGAGNVVADPLFSGRAPLPYAPKALSPCINSGADVGWTSADTDLAGNKRRCGAVVDMGCYEYRSTGLQIILQ